MPAGIGSEGAGVVEAVGEGVTEREGRATASRTRRRRRCLRRGAQHAGGSPRQAARRISFEQGAAMMLKGMTVQYLIKRTFKVQPGMTVLWHAVAGGVGLIACQWLKALGVTVIGTAGSRRKRRSSRRRTAATT